jgi:hypothetical protein
MGDWPEEETEWSAAALPDAVGLKVWGRPVFENS